jgi:hypothetical protein
MLDLRRMPQHHNPFAYMASELEKVDYATDEQAHEAGRVRDWLLHLAGRSLDLRSDDPVALVAVARCGTDAGFRQLLTAGIKIVETSIQSSDAR